MDLMVYMAGDSLTGDSERTPEGEGQWGFKSSWRIRSSLPVSLPQAPELLEWDELSRY